MNAPPWACLCARLRRSKRRASGDAGFTLIEMIVALAILGLSLGILFAGFSQAFDRMRFSQSQMNARVLAQALLEQAGEDAPLKAGTTQGLSPDGLAWMVSVAPFGTPEDRKAWQPQPAQVTARVSWSDNGTERTLSLTTLRFLAESAHR